MTKSVGKSPAFQFYASDWLSDGKRIMMTVAQRGAYIDLLAYQWNEGCIPKDIPSLARILMVDEKTMTELWQPPLQGAFKHLGTGLGNARLEAERAAQAKRREAMSGGGKKGQETQRQQRLNPDKVVTKGVGKVVETTFQPSSSSSTSYKKTWLTPYVDLWKATYGGEPSAGPLAKYLRPLEQEHGVDVTLARWEAYLKATDASFANPARFAQTFGSWDKKVGREMMKL